MMALPTMTTGCRAVFERRGGWSIMSGSIAERGLRGMRLLSLKLASVGAASLALTCHPGGGG
jgi:hypothetical protein